jgi:hypothetical protein
LLNVNKPKILDVRDYLRWSEIVPLLDSGNSKIIVMADAVTTPVRTESVLIDV